MHRIIRRRTPIHSRVNAANGNGHSRIFSDCARHGGCLHHRHDGRRRTVPHRHVSPISRPGLDGIRLGACGLRPVGQHLRRVRGTCRSLCGSPGRSVRRAHHSCACDRAVRTCDDGSVAIDRLEAAVLPDLLFAGSKRGYCWPGCLLPPHLLLVPQSPWHLSRARHWSSADSLDHDHGARHTHAYRPLRLANDVRNTWNDNSRPGTSRDGLPVARPAPRPRPCSRPTDRARRV